MGGHLAGVGLLVQGRHELYVSSVAALLSSRGATVRVLDPDAEPPRRLPADVSVVLLESPLPTELRRFAELGTPVIVMAERAGPEDRLAAAQFGATALLDKVASLAELVLAIRKAANAPAGPGTLVGHGRHGRGPDRYALTPRQQEVLGLIVEGLENPEIATRLGISERTARAHVSAVLERLGAANRTQAAVVALQKGLLAFLLALVTLAAGWVAAPATPAGAAVAGKLSSLSRAAGGSSGTWAYDADAGRVLVDWNGSVRRAPASVEKLLTSATALERLGPDTGIQTDVLGRGTLVDGVLDGDLFLVGHGDPSLGGPALDRLAQAIRRAGIEEVTGHVYGDETFFDSRRGGPSSGYATSIWVGPLSALAFNAGGLAPFGHGFQPNPPRFVAKRLKARLEALGTIVDDSPAVGKAPADTFPVASVASPPLSALVRHMNTVSDNYYAETLVKGLGARFGAGGTTAAGAAVVRAFERERGLDSRVVDGSGLSRANQVSPHTIGRLLLQARAAPWFASLYRSLPLAGSSGTLRKRMRGTPAAGRCRAKTGTLIRVSALAGYCRSRSGHQIVFAVLMNRVNIWSAHRAQDRIAASLAAYRG